MALTVAELIVELSKVEPRHANKPVVVYHSDLDNEFTVSGIEMNYDANDDGDVLLTVED